LSAQAYEKILKKLFIKKTAPRGASLLGAELCADALTCDARKHWRKVMMRAASPVDAATRALEI